MASQKNPNQLFSSHQNPNDNGHHTFPHNPFLQNQLPPRLTTMSSSQNPNSKNHLFTVPTSETHQFLNFLAPGTNGSTDSRAFSKPFEDQSLESAFGRMSLSSTPQAYLSQLGDDYKGLPYPFSFEQTQLLQQQLLLNNLNYLRSVSAGLGLQRPHESFQGIYNPALPNTYSLNKRESDASSFGESSDGDGYGYSYPSDRFKFDFGSPRNRPSRSFHNALETPNVNDLLSFYNRQKIQSRKYSCLEQLRGKVALAAKDDETCRFLNKQLDGRSAEHIEMIFLEVKDQLHDLILDSCANHLVQKLFEVCNEAQMRSLILALIHNNQKLLDICVHSHGTRALQKMIEHIKSSEQRAMLISTLKPFVIALSKSQNGHHVIMQSLVHFSADDCKFLMEEISQSCIDIAMDKSGCCVLQQAVTRARGEIREAILTKLATNALDLSEHPYGNYVVQHIIGLNVARTKASVVERLRGRYVALSMNKYGSNVVEKCLKECGEENAAIIITELMHSPNLLGVLQDPYGNYVAQTAITVAKGELFRTLVGIVQIHCHALHSHLHGKKVLETAARVSRQFHL